MWSKTGSEHSPSVISRNDPRLLVFSAEGASGARRRSGCRYRYYSIMTHHEWEQVQEAARTVRALAGHAHRRARSGHRTGSAGPGDRDRGGDSLSRDPLLSAVHGREPQGPACLRQPGRSLRHRDGRAVSSLRGIHALSSDLSDPRHEGAGLPAPGRLQCLGGAEPAVREGRPDRHRGPHQPAGPQPLNRSQRRSSGSAVSRPHRALRPDAAKPGPPGRPRREHRGPSRCLRRGDRARTWRPGPNTASCGPSAPMSWGCRRSPRFWWPFTRG